MLTQGQIQALLELAERAPKSPAEVLWLRGLVEELNAQMKAQRQEQKQAGAQTQVVVGTKAEEGEEGAKV